MAPSKKIKNPRAPSEVTQAWLEAVVSQYEATRSPGATVKVTSFQVNPGCGEQDNFQSDVMRIQAEAVLTYNNSSAASPTSSTATPSSSSSSPTTPLASSSSPKHYSFIAKFLCGNELQQETARNFGAPKREMLALAEIVPALNAFQKQHGNDKYRVHAPEYVYGACGTGEYVLVMQDLREAGFVMEDKRRGLGLPHLRLAVQHLAHFHAVSYAYSRTHDFVKMFPDFKANPLFTKIIRVFAHIILKNLKVVFESRKKEFPELSELLDTKIEVVEEKVIEGFLQSGDNRLMCFCHGDFWTNNFLFKNNENGDVEDFMMIDWGNVRWGSPVLDFQYLIHTSIQQEVRNHYQELQRLYFDTFTTAAAKLGAPLNDWEFEDFLAECRRTAMASILMGVIVSLVTLSKCAKKFNRGTLSHGTTSKLKMVVARAMIGITNHFSDSMISASIYSMMKKEYKKYFKELALWENEEMTKRITNLLMEAYNDGLLKA